MKRHHDIADMDEDDLRDRVEELEDALTEAQNALADVEAIRAAAVAYLDHLGAPPSDMNLGLWRMYETQLRADLVDALGLGSAQAGLLLMRRAS